MISALVPRVTECGMRSVMSMAIMSIETRPMIGQRLPPMNTCAGPSFCFDDRARGTRAEIMGDHIAIDEAAGWAGTISYELLTRLGSRYARLYTGLESETAA